MATASQCVRFTLSGGADPQTLDISALIGSTGDNNQIDASYCINGGVASGAQSTSHSGPVSGLAYNQTIAGLSAGDSVDIKIDADLNASVGETGALSLMGSATQTDADGCEKANSFNEQCTWTAIDGSATVTAPAPASIDSCIEGEPFGPFTGGGFTSSDSTPVTLTFAGVPAGVTFSENPAGSGNWIASGTSPAGGPFTVTITGTNGASNTAAQTVTIDCDAAAGTANGDGSCDSDGNIPFRFWCGVGTIPASTISIGAWTSSTIICGTLSLTDLMNTLDNGGDTYANFASAIPAGLVLTITPALGNAALAETLDLSAFAGNTSAMVAGVNTNMHALLGGLFTVTGNC